MVEAPNDAGLPGALPLPPAAAKSFSLSLSLLLPPLFMSRSGPNREEALWPPWEPLPPLPPWWLLPLRMLAIREVDGGFSAEECVLLPPDIGVLLLLSLSFSLFPPEEVSCFVLVRESWTCGSRGKKNTEILFGGCGGGVVVSWFGNFSFGMNVRTALEEQNRFVFARLH